MGVPAGFVRTSILVPEDFWDQLEQLAGQAAELCRQGLSEADAFSRAAEAAL